MKRIILVLTLSALTACGGGGGNSSESGPTTLTGVFVDSPVQGIEYSTASRAGTTDANGNFKYAAGETITFSMGGIQIGSAVKAASMVTVVDIVPGATDSSNTKVQNIAAFLQSLDTGGNLATKIVIPSSAIAAMSNLKAQGKTINFDTTSGMNSDVNALGVVTAVGNKMRTNEEAQNHLLAYLPGARSSCPGLPTVTYAGKSYKTVLIGTQCWLKENLDVGTMILGSQSASNNGTIEKYCYDDDPANCAVYGGLYQWNEAVAYKDSKGTKGICPDGFHVPTQTEFQILATPGPNNYGNALKAVGQGAGSGAGTNTSGFTALLAGGRDILFSSGNGYGGLNGALISQAYFWTSSEYYTGVRPNFYLDNISDVANFGNKAEAAALSVRCLKDPL